MGMLGKIRSGLGMESEKEGDSVSTVRGVRSMSNLAYVGDGQSGHFMDLVWSKEALEPIPVIFYFNGTSFSRTNRGRAYTLCNLLAKRDFLVVNAEFRDLRKDVSVEDEINDMLALIDWVITNRDQFHIDLDNVYVLGSSYGALMALWMAMYCNGHRMRDSLGISSVPLNIKGLGLFTGMTDTESGDDIMRPIAESIRKLKKTNKDLAECLCAWSNHDLRTLPPVFQVTGNYDLALPDVTRLENLLKINAVPCETMEFGPSSHTIRNFMEDRAEENMSIRTVSRMLTFFRDSQ